MSELSTESYKGVRDFYPADWARIQALFSTMRSVLTSWGYEEYNASPLERSELYESKGNEEIVNEQTYTFMDRGERSVTLRPEMTPTLARMVAHKRRELTFPLRWFSIGNRFRYERPQRGRLREFYQTDVDFVGASEGEADLEVVTLASTILKTFGASESDFIIRMNARPLLTKACTAAGLEGESVRRYLRLLDKKTKMAPAAFNEAAKTLSPEDPLALIEQDDARIQEEKKKVLVRIEELKKRGVGNVVFDPTLTRGFDYYTGMVFEIFDTDIRNPRALFGGGRYDGLVSLFGGEAIPAVGFAIGEVTLADFLETHGLAQTVTNAPALYLGTPTETDIAGAQELAKQLRSAGLAVFVNVTGKKLGDQIREADKRGIAYFSAVGEQERASGQLKVKKLATGEEKLLSLSEVPAFLQPTNL